MIAETYNKIRAYARRDRRRRALVIGLTAVAAVAVLAFVTVYRETIIQVVVGIGLVGLMIVGFLRGGLSCLADDSDVPDESLCSTEDGWRNGRDGFGWYLHGTRVEDELED